MTRGTGLPNGNEFSPGQVDLIRTLELVVGSVDEASAVEALRVEYFEDACEKYAKADERLVQQRKRARNVLLGARAYGLIEPDGTAPTNAGNEVLSAKDRLEAHRALAKVLLREKNAMAIIEAILGLQKRGDKVGKVSLSRQLNAQGFPIHATSESHMKIVRWLAEAEAIETNEDYAVDQAVVEGLAGISPAAASEFLSLAPGQRAALEVLRTASLGHAAEMPTKALVALIKTQRGGVLGREDQLAASTWKPLEEQGWIQRTGLTGGRGAKSGSIKAAEKLLDADFESISGYPEPSIPREVVANLDMPLAQIAADLASTNTHKKGIALEVLAARMALDLGLVPEEFRLRGASTGGAEVDLVAEGAHLHFSRWLIQCKNSAKVDLNALAKEVGMAVMLNGHVIVLVTTGKFAKSVAEHAKGLMERTPHQVVLVNGQLTEEYLKNGPGNLLAHFNRTAADTLRVKRPQLRPEQNQE